jgi:UDP-glucose 4-epimerase
VHVLITGGAGFVGSNLVRAVLNQGYRVTVLDDLSTGHAENLAGLDLRFVHGSVTTEDHLAEAMLGVQTVVHLGALGSVPRSLANPAASHQANATGTLMVLLQARRAGVEHLIYSSSSSVYGSNPALPKGEREWVRPMSPYAVSKLAAEQYVLAFQHSYGLPALAFRFFNIYGPRQRAGHPYAAVIPVFRDGLNSRDFTFVRAVCDVLVDAITRRVTYPEPVNLAFGTNTTLAELIKVIGQVTGRTPEIDYREPRPGDVRHSQADNSLLRQLFPAAIPVPLTEGITETLGWFERNRLANADPAGSSP